MKLEWSKCSNEVSEYAKSLHRYQTCATLKKMFCYVLTQQSIPRVMSACFTSERMHSFSLRRRTSRIGLAFLSCSHIIRGVADLPKEGVAGRKSRRRNVSLGNRSDLMMLWTWRYFLLRSILKCSLQHIKSRKRAASTLGLLFFSDSI